jgi:hypothetical protein
MGVGYVVRKWRYACLAVLLALLFAFIFTLVAGGSTDFKLLFSSLPVADKLSVLGAVFIKVFTNITSLGGVATLLLSLLQGITITLLIFNYKQQHKLDSAGAADSGIASVIALFGVGCSACGTSLLTPLITIFFSSSAYLVAEVLSNVIMIVAFVLILYAMRRLGIISFMTILAQRHIKGKKHEN